jgi:hypothetical protein
MTLEERQLAPIHEPRSSYGDAQWERNTFRGDAIANQGRVWTQLMFGPQLSPTAVLCLSGEQMAVLERGQTLTLEGWHYRIVDGVVCRKRVEAPRETVYGSPFRPDEKPYVLVDLPDPPEQHDRRLRELIWEGLEAYARWELMRQSGRGVAAVGIRDAFLNGRKAP